MYNGTKKWGSVRLTLKRCKLNSKIFKCLYWVYDEKHKYKKALKKERLAEIDS